VFVPDDDVVVAGLLLFLVVDVVVVVETKRIERLERNAEHYRPIAVS